MRKLIKTSLILIALSAQMAPVFANPPSEAQLAEWRAAAERRIQARAEVIRRVQGNNNWSAAETIMNRDSTIRYLESINRLERRYPGAVPQTEQSYRDVFAQLHFLKTDGKGAHSELKKDAAFRYFDQPVTVDAIGSGLTNRQLLSLAWAAIQDRSVFSTRQEREDRKWGLLESLANIQRAHNDCLAGGAIEWRRTHQEDSPSCEVGKFKRLLEHLDQLHPDVQLNPPLVEERASSPQAITDAILEGHRALAYVISASERHRIASEPAAAAAQAYRERLIARVREIHPAIQPATLEAHLGEEMMRMLFDADEWTAGTAQACHPAGGAAPGPALAAQINQILAPVAQVAAAPHPVAAHGIAPVLEDHPRFNQLSPQFRALGNIYEGAGLIWSGVAPNLMSHRDAVAYCAGLGGGARLPTKDEFFALSRAMGSRQPASRDDYGNWRDDFDVAGYNRYLIPDMYNRKFWSASIHPQTDDLAFVFDGFAGMVSYKYRCDSYDSSSWVGRSWVRRCLYNTYDSSSWVRCVVGG